MHSLPKLLGSMFYLVAMSGPSHAADAWSFSATGVPPPPPLNAAGEGRRLFLKLNCYSCHGMAAGGGMGPAIVGAERGDLSEALKQGMEGGMPSFRGYVTNTDISNLSAYLRSIGTPGEPTFNDWWVPVPPK